VAEFETPDDLIAASEKARDNGYKKMDAFAPFPVEGLSDAAGVTDHIVPWLTLAGGFFGMAVGYGLQYWAGEIAYPLNIGGRPIHSWPTFIPPTFECTVLFASLTGVISMIAINGLPMLYHPLFNVPEFDRASSDRFFLCIESKDKLFDRTGTRQFLEGLNPLQVSEVAR
jgi:hypothetical protein